MSSKLRRLNRKMMLGVKMHLTAMRIMHRCVNSHDPQVARMRTILMLERNHCDAMINQYQRQGRIEVLGARWERMRDEVVK